jgi:hypothetical protein
MVINDYWLLWMVINGYHWLLTIHDGSYWLVVIENATSAAKLNHGNNSPADATSECDEHQQGFKKGTLW